MAGPRSESSFVPAKDGGVVSRWIWVFERHRQGVPIYRRDLECWKMDFNGPGGVSSPTKKWFLAALGESN